MTLQAPHLGFLQGQSEQADVKRPRSREDVWGSAEHHGDGAAPVAPAMAPAPPVSVSLMAQKVNDHQLLSD